MDRRGFLRSAAGAAGTIAAAVASAGAQETTTTDAGNETAGNGTTTTAGGGGGGGGQTTVEVGPNGNYVFTPGTNQPLYITPGTTVRFVWRSDNHNIHVDSQPAEASWEGYEPIENEGFTYTHTFETMGEYHYWCVPHRQLGMVADIVVNEAGAAPGGGGAEELNPEEMGVPFQAHYVGIATVLMIVVSLVFTFFLLKYGESPNTKGSNR